MKRIILFLLLLTIISCSKEGEIKNQSTRSIKINGREYRFLKIVPADGEHAVWLLIPSDAKISVPEVISYRVNCGKNCHYNLTSLFVKS